MTGVRIVNDDKNNGKELFLAVGFVVFYKYQFQNFKCKTNSNFPTPETII